MNESELEQTLRGLRPSRPSHELEVRIGRELTPVPVARAGAIEVERKSLLERLAPAFGWAGLGAACAVVGMLSMNLVNGGAARKVVDKPNASEPVSAPKAATAPQTQRGSYTDDDILDASYEGVVDDSESGFGRRIRYTSIERRSWTDTDGAVTVVEIPREDVVVLPVSVQ